MADQNSQKCAENSLEIKLNEVFVGKRRLRYMYLYQPNIVSIKLQKDKHCMPLFLGCDVLDECNISSGNLPRFHAKHAKRGLATKVNFQPGVRVVGIHGTSRGVWFYSIQGLFKIAFDYYSCDEQSHCLCNLQDIWQRQIGDPVLTMEVCVVFDNSIEESENMTSGITSNLVKEKVDHSGALVDKLVYEVNKTIDSFVCENNGSLQHQIELLKTYISYMNHKETLDPFLNKTIKLINKCLKLLPNGSEKLDSSANLDTHNHLESNTLRYNNLSSSNKMSLESQNKTLFTRDVQINLGSQTCSDSEHFSKEVIILEISQWLGAEFLHYHGDISERVTKFKQQNMSSIGNLPSAEDLVSEVFPMPMNVFLCSWLQVPLTTNDCTEGSDNRSYLFPVIQLILELANQSLVSGVAHVLFSQLVQSDSVQ